LQEHCVRRGLGVWVDFDELITGRSELGFDYRVNTIDQHPDLSVVVKNYDQACEFFANIEERYNSYHTLEESHNV
jgi:hypothetical protein